MSTSYGTAISGLNAAKMGLSITGQNISNSELRGYSRQQVIQSDSFNQFRGNSNSGKMLVGLGTNVAQVRQIRNQFFDISYRRENSTSEYFAVASNTGEELSIILGEIQGKSPQTGIDNIWKSLNDLVTDPSSIQTRNTFIQNASFFLGKMQDVNDNMIEYQMRLNDQVKQEVEQINSIIEEIDELNEHIVESKVYGTAVNDALDSRNALLDKLSGYMDIVIRDNPSGRVDITFQGVEILANNTISKIGLRYVGGEFPFVEPVFTASEGILPATDTSARSLFNNLGTENLSASDESKRGSLKSLLISRGSIIGDYTRTQDEVNNFTIPKIQRQLDTLAHKIITLLNDAVKPANNNPNIPPYDLNGNTSTEEIFMRTSNVPGMDRFTDEDPTIFGTLYTLRNVKINPRLMESDGYNLLAFSQSGDKSDTTILNGLVTDWKANTVDLDSKSVDTFYNTIISDMSVETNINNAQLRTQQDLLNNIVNKRASISGVSLDEELNTMMKYQYAYNAASKIINVLEKMLDRIMN